MNRERDAQDKPGRERLSGPVAGGFRDPENEGGFLNPAGDGGFRPQKPVLPGWMIVAGLGEPEEGEEDDGDPQAP